jgi:hypothetical protein
MFSNEPVYLASFEVELLAFRCHVVLQGYTFIKVKFEVFNMNTLCSSVMTLQVATGLPINTQSFMQDFVTCFSDSYSRRTYL